jgi:hypothetical protein
MISFAIHSSTTVNGREISGNASFVSGDSQTPIGPKDYKPLFVL